MAATDDLEEQAAIVDEEQQQTLQQPAPPVVNRSIGVRPLVPSAPSDAQEEFQRPARLPAQTPGPLPAPSRVLPRPPVVTTGNRAVDAANRQERANENYDDRLTRFNASAMFEKQQAALREKQRQAVAARANESTAYAAQEEEKGVVNTDLRNTLKNQRVQTERDPETGIVRPVRDDRGQIKFTAGNDEQVAQDRQLHKVASGALSEDVYTSALNIRKLRTVADTKQEELKKLFSESEQLKTTSEQTSGGFLGIGKSPTPEALAAKARLEEINPQIDELRQAGYGNPSPKVKGRFTDPTEVVDAKNAHKQLAADKKAWGQLAITDEGQLDDALQERQAAILAGGGDPSKDRVIQAIEARRKELGIVPKVVDPAEKALRNDPTYGPMISQRDNLDAQVKPLESVTNKLLARLEDAVGLQTNRAVQDQGDPDARIRMLQPFLDKISDPAVAGKARTLLNALEPRLKELRGTRGQREFLQGQVNLQLRQQHGYNTTADDRVQIHAGDVEGGLKNAVDKGAVPKAAAEQHGPELRETAAAANSLSKLNPQADGTQPPIKTMTGMEATLQRVITGGARAFDKGVEGIARFADKALVLPGVSKGGGALKQFADYLKARTDKYDEFLGGSTVDGQRLSPESAKGASGVVSSVASGLIGMAPSLAAGGIPGLISMAVQALGQSSADARDAKLKAGGTEEEADKEGYKAAAKTLPTLALYAAAGPAAGKIIKSVMPVGASPFLRAATTFAVQAPMNMAASAGGKLVVGEDPKPTMDSAINDALFATLGMRDAYTHGKDVQIAQTMMTGEHPEIAVMNGIAQNKSGAFAPEMQDLAQIYANRMRAIAQHFLEKHGEKIPDVSTEGATEPTEKQATAREIPKTGLGEGTDAGTAAATGTGPKGPKPTPEAAHAEIDGLQAGEAVKPEQVEQTQHALRGLVKIASGQPMDSLTAVEKQALLKAKTEDGMPRVEMVKGPEGARPVITDGTLERVRAIAPTVAQLLPENEETQRQTILAGNQEAKNETKTGSGITPLGNEPGNEAARKTSATPLRGSAEQAGSGTPASETPTFAVEVENAKGETTVVNQPAATAAEAKSAVAKTIKPGQGLIRSVDQISQPPASAPKTDFVERAVQSVAAEKGKALSADEEKQVRVVARVFKPHVERWEKAFESVDLTATSLAGGGAMLAKGKKLVISVPDVVTHHMAYAGNKAHAANVVTEEAIHSVTVHLEESGAIDLVKLYKALPAKIHAAMKGAYKYKGADDYHYAHEFWRMWMQGDLELQRGNKIRLKGKFLQEQTSRAFVVENRRALATLLRFFRDMSGQLDRAKAGKDVIAEVGRAQDLIRAKVKEVDAHAQPASEKGGDRENQDKTAVSAEPSGARGPPAGKNEPGGEAATIRDTGRDRANDRGRGADAAPAEAAAGTVESVTGEKLNDRSKEISETGDARGSAGAERSGLAPASSGTREQITSRLGGIVRGAVGATSRLTQNGRTLEVVFVAQEAADARPSHDVQGRTVAGYDQDLQPRDRSLPQYRKQAQNIANNLDFAQAAFFPETKTPATTADLGAPIMTLSGDTLIGNGREIGIRTAYEQSLVAARKYKAKFVRNAKAFGIDPAAVIKMKEPVLKRVILEELPKDDLVRLSQESNEGAAMGANASEIAGRDASRITPGLLSLFDPNYALDAGRNSAFLRAYARDVVRGEGANEANLNPAEMARRVRAAVFTYAYGADETGRAALQRLAGDESDAGGKNITNALLTVAPIVARMKTDIGSGDLYPLDISPAISRAVQDISEALRNRPAKQSADVALAGLTGQAEFELGNQETRIEKAVTEFLVDNRGKRAAIEEALSNYVEAVFMLGSPKQGDLFNVEKVPTTQELWQEASSPAAIAPKTEARTLAAQAIAETLPAPDIGKDDETTAQARADLTKLSKAAERNLSPEFKAAVDADAKDGYPNLPGFFRAEGLSREERLIEAHFAQQIAADKPGTLARYEKLAEAEFGIASYANADLARDLYAPYRNNKRSRLFLERATIAPAGYVALGMEFSKALREAATNPDPAKPYAMFMAGGMASGKTTSVNKVLSPDKDRSAIVYDSVFQNYDRAKASLEQSIAAGLRPVVVFVYRPFEKASDGAIYRTITTGRPVRMASQGRAHFDSQQTFLRLESEFKVRADFKVLFNDGVLSDIREESVDALRAVAYENSDETSRENLERAYGRQINEAYAAGRLDSAQYQALRSGNSATWPLASGEGQGALQSEARGQTSAGALRSLLDRYDEGDKQLSTISDLTDEVEALSVESGSPELEEAVSAFREEQRYDLELGGRNDMDEAAAQFIAALEVIVAKGRTLSAQRTDSGTLDLFADYAATLPAAAKVSKPALKREVAKDVPTLADDEAALAELFALAKPPGRNLSSPEAAKSETPKVQNPTSQENSAAPTVIQDFGEKLGGARKDISASMNREISDDDIARLPLSEIWPKSEVDAIEDIPLAALATAVRAEIPAKPRQGYKVQRWAEKVKQVRGLMRVAGEQGYDAVIAKMGEYRLAQLVNKIRLLQSLPREHWGRIGRVWDHPDAYQYKRDTEGNPVFENGQMARIPAPTAGADVNDRSVGAANLADLTDKVTAKLSDGAQVERMKFEVRGREGRDWFINKKGDPLYRRLKTFNDSKEAVAYARNPENYDALTAAWDGVKESDNVKETDVRRVANRDRIGKDWRNGGDATPEMFIDSFGFRGAEFGNWVSQGKNIKERQGMLNAAFDALHDLAETVHIPPKAISLNGTLGLGFGSRGHGWASAHFEPGNLVINLTKPRGAGKLAHEWFHALDNYFQRQRNETGIAGRHGDYITNNPETYYEGPTGQRLSEARFKELSERPYNAGRMNDWKRIDGVRPQVAEAFAELVQALDASPMAKRAALIDKGKSDGYWSRTIERAARSFENYVIARMQLDGASNDYLANVTAVEDFARDKGRYPYLLPDEIAPVSAAFDQLFDTLETTETEKGVALYAQPTGGAENPLFEQGLPLATQIANRYNNIRGVEPGDVLSRARSALARAAEKFDPARGAFLPFARTAINNELRGMYRAAGRNREETTLDESPEVGGQKSEVSRKDQLVAPSDTRSEVELAESRSVLDSAVAELPARMQGAITGILDGDTLEAIGERLGGISRQAVGRLASEAMRRLRGKLGERGITSARDLLAQPIHGKAKSPIIFVGKDENLKEALAAVKGDSFETLHVLTPSAKKPGKWQLTEFYYNAENGGLRPMGDTEYDSVAAARKAYRERNYKALSGPNVLKQFDEAFTLAESSEKLDITDATIEDALAAQASSDPLQQLIDSLDADALDTLFDKASAEERGSYETGRPDLALGAEGPAQRATDQYYTDLAKVRTRETLHKEAEAILAERGVHGFAQEIAATWLRGDTLHDDQVVAAKTVLAELSRHTDTPEGLQRMMAAGFAYRNIRGQTARDLAAGFDPHKTPEERNREFIAKAISTLPAKKEAQIAAEPDTEKRQRLLDEAMQERLAQLEKAFAHLSKGGLTLEDVLGGGWELHGKGVKLIESEMAGYDVPHQKALKLAQTGARSAKEIAQATGLSEAEVERVNDQFISSLRDKLREKVRAGLTLEKIDLQGALFAQETGGEPAGLSDEAVNAELARIIKGMGFVASKDLGKFKVVKRKRPKLFVPPAAPYTGRVPDSSPVPFEERRQNQLAFKPGDEFRNVNPKPGDQVVEPTGRVLGQIGLPLYQEMMVRRGADMGNVDDVVKIARVMQAANGNAFDMLFEAWIQGILSGLQTQVANVAGNATSVALDFTLQRGMEALVNLVYRDADSAQLGEFKHIARGIMPGLQRGLSLAVRAWNAEADFFRNDVLNEQVEMFEDFDKGGGVPPAIPGRTGRVVRMPGRALLFMDAAFKGLIGQAEAGAQAYRIAKKEGLKDEALSARMNELQATPGSEAWIRAADKARYLTFQDPILTSDQGGGVLDNAVAKFNQARAGSHLLGYYFPFIRTPYNIFKVGLRKTPLGSVPLLSNFAKAGFYRMKDGKPVFESYSKARQVRDIAEQLIAWTVFGALWAATTGDDDDDKKPFLLIGSTPYTETKKGERELYQRAYGGPYQLRIGGRNGVYLNYGRYEPIATVLGTVVDAITNLKKLKHGQTFGQTLDAMHGYFLAQAESKTFLQGFGNIAEVLRGTKSVSEGARAALFQAIVPNLIRQPLRNLDEFVRDQKGAGAAYQMFPTGALAEPKVDPYGRDVRKGGNALTRLFFATGTEPYAQLKPADKMLLNWNKKNPQATWGPTLPTTTYKDAAGKNQQMTSAEARKFYEASGKRAEQMLRGQIDQRMIDHPTEEDVKTVKDIFEEAHRLEKVWMFSKKHVSSVNLIRAWRERAAA